MQLNEIHGFPVPMQFVSEFNEALQIYSNAIKLLDLFAYYFREKLYLKMGKEDDARRDFIEALKFERDPQVCTHIRKELKRLE